MLLRGSDSRRRRDRSGRRAANSGRLLRGIAAGRRLWAVVRSALLVLFERSRLGGSYRRLWRRPPDEGEAFALAVRKSELIVTVKGQSRALGLSIQPLVWYSAVLSVDTYYDKTEVLVHIKQVKGLPGPAAVHDARAAFDGAVARFDKLLLATRVISPIGSAVDGFNGKIDSPAFFDRALGEQEYAALHADARENARLAWNFAENFRSREIREVAGRAPSGVIRNGAERAVTGRNWTGLEDYSSPHRMSTVRSTSTRMRSSMRGGSTTFPLSCRRISRAASMRCASRPGQARTFTHCSCAPEARAPTSCSSRRPTPISPTPTTISQRPHERDHGA